MELTAEEKAMLDGAEGPAAAKAMDLLVRYGEALGADRLVETNNVAGVIGSSTPFMADYYAEQGAVGRDAIFSRFDLDSDEVVDIPQAKAFTCHLQTRVEPNNSAMFGLPDAALKYHQETQEYSASKGVNMLNTCTPHAAGNTPVKGEHCAWMESSAVVYINSVIGARSNTEGRESAAAAMLTRRIPYWGFHTDAARLGQYRVDVEIDVDSVMDWGMLGYYVGNCVGESVPVITGIKMTPNLVRHKHFGAAAASSGGVEMYHVVGVTPDADTVEEAFGSNKPKETFKYGKAEMKATYENLNAKATGTDVDYVMLGCPHYTIEQVWEAARLLDGKKISGNTRLWIFTNQSVKQVAVRNGYARTIEKAGGLIMTDTCSAMAAAAPKGTKVAATDSAKQTHYLPAIVGVEAWFGSTEDCINAALSGKWQGKAP